MEEYTQITLDQWLQWKEDIRRKLQETAGNFVYIGYRLKQIRDSGMFDGCTDIFEFAQREYGLSKSTVSRFIAINEKFSEGGNSLELREEYRAIGSSKLAEMLTLPDSECQLITERTTVKEIRELKQFGRQVVPEEREETSYTPLQKCIIGFFEEKKDVLNQIMETLNQGMGEEGIKKVAGIVNPGEYATYKKGIIFLFLYEYKTGVKYKSMAEPKPISMTWEEFLAEVVEIYGQYQPADGDIWADFYQKRKPEEETAKRGFETAGRAEENQVVATSQQKNGTEEKSEEKSDVKRCEEESGEESDEEEADAAADVPEEIGWEQLPRGENRGDGISWKEPRERTEMECTLPPTDAVYRLKIGKTCLAEIKNGLRYMILKKEQSYRAGNTLRLEVLEDGEEIGILLDIKITHITDDHGGITPGYCVLQFEILPPVEKDVEGQMDLEEILQEQEERNEADEETGIHGESQEIDT